MSRRRAPVCRRAVRLIKHFEGFSAEPYLCPAGVLTIGHGATYGVDRRRVGPDHPPLDAAGAEALLRRDLARFALAVDRMVVVPIGANQHGALTSFAFNLGSGALRASTLLRRVNAGAWDDVPDQFHRWVFAGGRRLAGLVRRREAEAELWGMT